MKIAPKIADNYAAKPDPQHRAILLYGPDAGLVRERAKRLTKSQLPGETDPFALVEMSESSLLADPARLSDELAAISMMAPKRVILLRDAGDKLTRIIESASDAFNDCVLLIVCANELSTRSSLRAWFEKTPSAAAIACYKDEPRDVQEVIRKTLTAAGLPAEYDIVQYLSQQLGNDRFVTYQELEKLITYAGEEKQLRLSDVQALIDYNRDTELDDVVTAVADRNLAALDATLTLLMREGTQPVAWIRALQRYFNRLYFIKSQIGGGQTAEQIIHGLRPPVFFKQVPALTRHVQSWSLEQIVKALKLLVAAELACKTSDLPPVPASSRKLLQMTQVR